MLLFQVGPFCDSFFYYNRHLLIRHVVGSHLGFLHRISQKQFPYLSRCFVKSVCYLIKIVNGIYYSVPYLDVRICVISLSARIDFLQQVFC